MTLLFAILLTVTLSPPFGEAEAHALGAPSARTFDVTVQVEGEPAAVLVRITGLAGELPPVALVPRGGGTYGQAIKLTAWEDVLISFEYIDVDGTTTISTPSSLSALGIDPGLLGLSAPTSEPAPAESGVDPRLLAGVAAALAAVVLLAFWASGGLALPGKSQDWMYSASVDDADDEESRVKSQESRVQSPESSRESPESSVESS
jgi:hypothetical protein